MNKLRAKKEARSAKFLKVANLNKDLKDLGIERSKEIQDLQNTAGHLNSQIKKFQQALTEEGLSSEIVYSVYKEIIRADKALDAVLTILINKLKEQKKLNYLETKACQNQK